MLSLVVFLVKSSLLLVVVTVTGWFGWWVGLFGAGYAELFLGEYLELKRPLVRLASRMIRVVVLVLFVASGVALVLMR